MNLLHLFTIPNKHQERVRELEKENRELKKELNTLKWRYEYLRKEYLKNE